LRAAAAKADISPALLSLIERDLHVPPKEVLVRLAGVLEGDADQWCGLIGTITPDTEAALARKAVENPDFFRTMVGQSGVLTHGRSGRSSKK